MIGFGEFCLSFVVACVLMKPEDLPRLLRGYRDLRKKISSFWHACSEELERVASAVEGKDSRGIEDDMGRIYYTRSPDRE